jgi:hypothetical protein
MWFLMRALVVYTSMYGNTHAVAVSIAAGLSTGHDVTLAPVTRATPELVAAADLLVVGGPTHLHRMSTRRLPALGALQREPVKARPIRPKPLIPTLVIICFLLTATLDLETASRAGMTGRG